MLSKFALLVSSGRKSAALTSTPSRSLHHTLVLGAVEALESARAGVRRPGTLCQLCFREFETRSSSVSPPGRREPGGGMMSARSLRIDLFRLLEVVCRRLDFVVVERHVALWRSRVVAAAAVTLDNGSHLGGLRQIPRGYIAQRNAGKRMLRRFGGRGVRGVAAGRERESGGDHRDRCNNRLHSASPFVCFT